MGAMTATACGKRRFVSIDGGRERSQTEEQDEQDGESAAHLEIMLHECWSYRRFWKPRGLQVSSMHPEFPLTGRKVGCCLK